MNKLDWKFAVTNFALLLVPLIVVHETIYYNTIDPEIVHFLSISDYVDSAIAWMPIYLVSMFSGLSWSVHSLNKRRLQNDVGSDEADIPTWRKRIYAIVSVILTIFIVLFGSETAPIWTSIGFVSMLIVVTLYMILDWRLMVFPEPELSHANHLCMLVFFLFAAASSISYLSAVLDINRSGQTRIVGHSEDEVVVLRDIQRGILIRSPEDKRVLLLDHSGNTLVEFSSVPGRPRFCSWFELFCDKSAL